MYFSESWLGSVYDSFDSQLVFHEKLFLTKPYCVHAQRPPLSLLFLLKRLLMKFLSLLPLLTLFQKINSWFFECTWNFEEFWKLRWVLFKISCSSFILAISVPLSFDVIFSRNSNSEGKWIPKKWIFTFQFHFNLWLQCRDYSFVKTTRPNGQYCFVSNFNFSSTSNSKIITLKMCFRINNKNISF